MSEITDETKSPWGILTGIRPAKIATKLLDEGMSDDEVISYFINECGTTYEKASLALEAARALRPIRDDMYQDGGSIYIGIRFARAGVFTALLLPTAQSRRRLLCLSI